MDKERIVGASPHWDKLKDIFHNMGLTVSRKSETCEHISHGVLIIVNGEGLFLQMAYTYEYRCILRGAYTGAKLYHYLSLVTRKERELLLLHPFVQWKTVYPYSNMPGELFRKMIMLQTYLPALFELIPLDTSHECNDANIISPTLSPTHSGTLQQDISINDIHNSEDTLSLELKQLDSAIQSISIDLTQYSYLLTIPKGRKEEGESSKEAALRELQEETGIELSVDSLSLCVTERYMGTDGNMYITYIYAAFLDERPKVTLGQEFKGYLWLSCDENMLLRRQIRILQTFLTDVNDRHIKQNCRRDNCGWLQQIGEIGYNQTCQASKEPSSCSSSTTRRESTDDQKYLQLSCSTRNDSCTIQSLPNETSLSSESSTY